MIPIEGHGTYRVVIQLDGQSRSIELANTAYVPSFHCSVASLRIFNTKGVFWENKTNCLARWPHIVNIQTISMDETTVIGVIELKTCIQAIVSAR